MAEFIYTTSTSVSGPWLIDSDKLEALDKVLGEEWERITRRNEEIIKKEIDRRINEEKDYITTITSFITDESRREEEIQSRLEVIESRIRSYGDRDARSITIYLRGNKKIIVESFGEAMRQQSLLEEMPVGFDAVLRSGDIKSEIELRRSGSLDISVSPEHLAESRELFAALQRWATSVRPPKWQRLWVLLNPLQWLLWVVVLFIGLMALAGSESAAKSFYKEQAKQLLQDGLSQGEQLKALEIILALESDYVPQGQNVSFPGWYTLLFFGGLGACIILTITPKPRIGIGKGQDAINRWRLWIRIVFIVVPSFVFINIIWPYLSRLLQSLL